MEACERENSPGALGEQTRDDVELRFQDQVETFARYERGASKVIICEANLLVVDNFLARV